MISYSHTIKVLVTICFTALLLGSCKSKRITSDKMKSQKELQHALELHNHDFEWFSAEGKIKYKNVDESGSARINVRMKKDSVIWLNVKKYMLEWARVQITPDSVYVVYRMENIYTRGTLEQFTRDYNTNFNFTELQELFFGNVTTTENINFVARDSTKYHLSAEKNGIKYDYHVNPYNLLLEKFYASDNSRREVIGKYRDYKRHSDGNLFSYFREYTFKEEDEVTYLAIDYSDIEIDVPKKIKFSIPSHYDGYEMY